MVLMRAYLCATVALSVVGASVSVEPSLQTRNGDIFLVVPTGKKVQLVHADKSGNVDWGSASPVVTQKDLTDAVTKAVTAAVCPFYLPLIQHRGLLMIMRRVTAYVRKWQSARGLTEGYACTEAAVCVRMCAGKVTCKKRARP